MDWHHDEDILDDRDASPSIPSDCDKPEMLIPIRQFSAFNGSCNPVEVIGVGYFNDMLQFLVIQEDGGMVFPVFRENIFKDLESAQDAISLAEDAV